MIAGVPRIAPGAVPRARLLAALDDDAPLRVLRGAAGSGKTTVLAQWVSSLGRDRRVVWVTLGPGVGSRAGFWTRILVALHRRAVIDDEALYREVSAVADSPGAAPGALGRALTGAGGTVDLVLDGFGGPSDVWDAICRDLVALLARESALRCVVSGEVPTLLEGPGASAAVHTRVLRDADLVLTTAEAQHMIAASGARLQPEAAADLAARESLHPVSELRHVLEALAAASGELSVQDVDALLPAALLQDIAARVGDAESLDRLGALALAPFVDVELAGRIVGAADAPAVLTLLERTGLGAWSGDDGSVFRLGDHVREVVGAQFSGAHPQRARAIEADVARWVAARGQDPASAVELALRAGDLDYAERLLLRHLPTLLEEPGRLSGVLEAMPVRRLRRYPFLAVVYALALNARPGRQGRAAAVLAAVGAATRARMSSAPRAERAVLYGLETGVWRLLGQRPRMVDTARRVVRELTEAREQPEERRDPDLVVASAMALSQAATSLLFGDDVAGAREAFDLLSTVAAEQEWGHYANVAACGRAMIDVLDGRIGSARAELASLDPQAWPQAWLNAYAGAFRNVAQAWVHLDDGDPGAALAELELLAPHVETIEHWEFIATPTALAQAMLGHATEAEAWLEQLAADRVGPRTLPSVQRRLMAARSLVQLASGSARDWPERRPRGRASAVASAMQALAAAVRGADADAVALLAAGESDVLSPLQQALVAVAGVTVAQRTAAPVDAAPFGVRLATLATAHGLHWPVTLLAEADRDLLVTTLARDAGPQAGRTLARSFETIPAIVDEQLWRSGRVPTLTPRERDVLRVLARTESRSEIAAELFVSVNTVKAQLRSLYTKLDARSRDEALHRAIAFGLLSDSRPATAGTEDAAGTH